MNGWIDNQLLEIVMNGNKIRSKNSSKINYDKSSSKKSRQLKIVISNRIIVNTTILC